MTITANSSHIRIQLTGIGWVNSSGSGRSRCDSSPNWSEGTPVVPTSILKSLKGGSRFGRLDLFSQIGVAAIGLALQDAGYLQEQPAKKTGSPLTDFNPSNTGLICATTSSCSITDHNFFNTVKDKPCLASPGLFVYTLATSFLGEAALRFSLTGLTMALIEPRPRALDAIFTAIEELNTGDDDIMVAGLCNLFEYNKAPQISGAIFLVLEKECNPEETLKDRRAATLNYDPQKKELYCNNHPCPDIFSICKMACG